LSSAVKTQESEWSESGVKAALRAGIATPARESSSTNVTGLLEGLESAGGSAGGREDKRSGNGDYVMAENTMAEERKGDPNEKLVKVFDSEQESEALVVKGLLDSAGIESDLASASLLQDAFPGMGGMIILVREEDAGKARELIASSQQAVISSDAGPSTVDDDETKGD
jgi:Putative prokaryotic signal transducing protein